MPRNRTRSISEWQRLVGEFGNDTEPVQECVLPGPRLWIEKSIQLSKTHDILGSYLRLVVIRSNSYLSGFK